MKQLPFLVSLVLLLFASCQNKSQLKSFNNVITADDSLSIALSRSVSLTYHSPVLDIDIQYPSYLSLGEADHSCLVGFLLIWNKVIDPSLLCNTKTCNFLDKQNQRYR